MPNQLNFSDISVPDAALGSVIVASLGTAVAEPATFDHLLWPQRFYRISSLKDLLEMAILNPLGGPVHNAALVTLDQFRQNGLYGGAMQGHMLGTAFYPDKSLKYRLHGYTGTDTDDEVRNGLWVTVLQYSRDFQKMMVIPSDRIRSGDVTTGPSSPRRTTQAVRHLRLWNSVLPTEPLDAKIFSEDRRGASLVLPICISEITALVCAMAIHLYGKCDWFAIYVCLPLLFKLLSITLSVRRGPKNYEDENNSLKKSIRRENSEKKSVIFEISDYNHGFPLIEGPEHLVRQFFKHWGHPLRETGRDRLRELGGIALVGAFAFYFPIGLLSMAFVSRNTRAIWLLYQLYVTITMYIQRLHGSTRASSMAKAMAAELSNGKLIGLRNGSDELVMAKLEIEPMAKIQHGKDRVRQIIQRHTEQLQNSDMKLERWE